VRSVAKQTVLAAFLAWIAARVLRRVLGVAVLGALIAGAAGLVERHGVHVGGAGRVPRCDVSALMQAVGQLTDAIARGSSSTHPALAALRRLARCHAARPPTRAARR
jgi:hypothetical protein